MKPRRIYQVRISLDGIAPAIWRQVLVPPTITLRQLHNVIQKTMGWTNSHLHMFEFDGRQFARPDPHSDVYVEDDARARLREGMVTPGETIAYEYDFGDAWRHTLLLEEVVAADGGDMRLPRCIAGARACPPEDCGGIPGYQAFLEAILDPFHPEHRSMREWIGGDFDPERFDVAAADRALARKRSAKAPKP